jgi:hypothetical protein
VLQASLQEGIDMPSKTEPQARLMAAIAHGWHPDNLKHAPSRAVATEFNQADKGSALLSHAMQHHAAGGAISPLASLVGDPMTMRATLPKLGNPMGAAGYAGHMRMPHIPIGGALHNIDQHMAGAREKLPSLKAGLARGGRYADGGEVKLGARAISAIKDALSHLANRDASSAAATLRSSPEAMQHPVVQQAAQSLRSSTGIAPATRNLTGIVSADTDRTLMPLAGPQ